MRPQTGKRWTNAYKILATNGIVLKKIFEVGSRKNEFRMLNSVDENLHGSETMKAEKNTKYY